MIAFKFKWSAIGVATAVFAAAPLVHAAAVPGQGTWETTLQGRDLDGDAANGFEAYYDTVLDITWLADANYAATSGYTSASNGGKAPGSEYDSNGFGTDGSMGWDAAMTWATNLNVHGVTGWRLPTMVDTGKPGCDFAYGGTDCGFNPSTSTAELAHLYYSTLGHLTEYSASTDRVLNLFPPNTGPFKNVQSPATSTLPIVDYHYGLEYAPSAYASWKFSFENGSQGQEGKGYPSYAWAVRTGDIAAVPEPEGYALALLGLTLVGLAARRRHR